MPESETPREVARPHEIAGQQLVHCSQHGSLRHSCRRRRNLRFEGISCHCSGSKDALLLVCQLGDLRRQGGRDRLGHLPTHRCRQRRGRPAWCTCELFEVEGVAAALFVQRLRIRFALQENEGLLEGEWPKLESCQSARTRCALEPT